MAGRVLAGKLGIPVLPLGQSPIGPILRSKYIYFRPPLPVYGEGDGRAAPTLDKRVSVQSPIPNLPPQAGEGKLAEAVFKN